VERTFRIRRTQSISFTWEQHIMAGDTAQLNAHASSLLPVAFSVVAGPATLSGNTIVATGPGEVTVKASQPGNDQYVAAPDVTQRLCILPAVPVVTAEGITLKSSSPTGNQWVVDGEPIPGATGPTLLATAAGHYSVIVKGPCGQPMGSNELLVAVSATEPALGATLRLYPNPAASQVTLTLPDGVRWQSATVVDGQGRQALAQPAGTGPVTFATGGLAKGLYLLEVRTAGGVIRRKFLVQ
jgi:hypothetical protein